MLQDKEVHAAEVGLKYPYHISILASFIAFLSLLMAAYLIAQMERTFIAIKPDGVQRGLVKSN